MKDLKTQNLKRLMTEYEIEQDPFSQDDQRQTILNAVRSLPDPDRIILFLYAELQSYRKLANLLNVSFTTAYKSVKEIRKKILELC